MKRDPVVNIGIGRAEAGRSHVAIQKKLVSTVSGSIRIQRSITDLARTTVSSGGLNAGTFINVTRDVIKGAIRAADETGLGRASTSRYVAKGIIMGVHDVGGDIVAAADHAFKCAVNEGSEVGGDVGQIARATSDGVIEATKELGGNLEEVAKALVSAAVESTSIIGRRSIHATGVLMVGVVENAKDVSSGVLFIAEQHGKIEDD